MYKTQTITLIGAALAAALAAQPARGDLKRATQRGCTGCHNVDIKILGPAYKAVARKYQGDNSALERLAAKVKTGGSGTWGAARMPPHPKLSDEQIKEIVSWILSLEAMRH
jgi:cytochrome c551/c552